MSEEYLDPNSGKAMQPGAIAFPGPEAAVEQPKAAASEGGEEEGFDPSKHNVDDVLAYVEENPDSKADVLKAEKDGKNRVSLVSALEADE